MSAPRGQTIRLRTCLLVTLLALGTALSACGGDPAGGGAAPRPSSEADAAVPGAGALRDEDVPGTAATRSEEEREGSADEAATPSVPVAGSNAPPGFVELRGEGDDFHAAMTEGDGTAEPLLLTEPPLGEGWQVVEADGPRFVQTVCGVQLDPVQPRDAAHRRWGLVENFSYLTSEVHVFAEPEGQGLAEQVAEALEGCDSFGIDREGMEVPAGSGAYQVTVSALDGLPQPWVAWTETTEDVGLVRHNALRDVDGGWHWVSLVGSLGTPVDPDLLVGAVGSEG